MRLLAAALAVLLPQAAAAECLGQGCYDGLLTVLVLLAVGAVAIAVLLVWLVVRLIRRIRAGRPG